VGIPNTHLDLKTGGYTKYTFRSEISAFRGYLSVNLTLTL